MGQVVPRIFRGFQCTAVLLFLTVAALGSEPLTNEIIIKMVQAGVPTETIIRTIQSAESFRFGTLPGDLMQLQQANVPEEIVRALAARINWPGTPPLVIAHPMPAPAPAAAPQKPSKVKAVPAKGRQPLPVVFPPAAPVATASIGAPVAAAPATDPFQAALARSDARGNGRSLRASTGRALRHFWSYTPFGLLGRLFRR
jgi:hypothetical protein